MATSLREPFRAPFRLYIAYLLAVLFFGYAVATRSGVAHLFILVPIAACVALVAGATSWAPYCLTLLGVATVAYAYALPQLGVGSVGLYPSEGAVLIGALVTLVRRRHYSREWAWPGIEVGVGLVLLGTAVGVVVGFTRGVPFKEAFISARPMLFLVCFWIAGLALLRAESRRRLFTFVSAAAVVVVALQGFQLVLGVGRSLFLIGENTNALVEQTDFGGAVRVRPPGLTLVYIVTIFAISYLIWGPKRHRGRAAALSLVGMAGILISLNRNMIVGLALGLLCAWLFGSAGRKTIVGAAGVLVLLLMLTVGVVGLSPALSGSPIVQRLTSLGNYQQLSKSTLSDRFIENRAATAAIRSSPVVGVGWGTSYGAYVSDRRATAVRAFVHNQYLGLWLRTGLLGLIGMLVACVVALRSGTRWCRGSPWDDESWLGTAVIASIVSIMASATVGLYFSTADSLAPLMGVLALAALLRRRPAPGNTDGG